ncbi:helix-turn-helix domain-containing protein [Kitasatospora sp. NPDC004669]|uniref:helix-turn-helix domain-containing protein n=1 Tax=Kitasatospora sp. NPDC004669 TaxID=3154555 RepID=UPI0033B4B4ED
MGRPGPLGPARSARSAQRVERPRLRRAAAGHHPSPRRGVDRSPDRRARTDPLVLARPDRHRAASAARALRIHPDTLHYRLRRMAEVATVDLCPPQVRPALRLLLGALPAGPNPLTPPAGRCGPPQPA